MAAIGNPHKEDREMVYRALGWLHATAYAAWTRARDQRGQGTVEYVGMVVLVTLLVAAVATASKGWAPDIGASLKKALQNAIKKLVDPFAS
jgi:Flp pilus assembly pilin Flp